MKSQDKENEPDEIELIWAIAKISNSEHIISDEAKILFVDRIESLKKRWQDESYENGFNNRKFINNSIAKLIVNCRDKDGFWVNEKLLKVINQLKREDKK